MLAMHLGRLKDAGTLRTEQVSFGKYHNVSAAMEVARSARTILGANGITLEYPVLRHANNLESVLTYEGTHEMHTLILGQAITGIAGASRNRVQARDLAGHDQRLDASRCPRR